MAARKAAKRKKRVQRPRRAPAKKHRRPKPGKPDPIPDWSDEDAEIFGGLFWAEFTRGAKRCTFDTKVIEKGRELSRGWIRANCIKHGEDFPVDKTAECARRCGVKARQLAGGSGAITATNFKDAWEYVKNHHALAIARLQRMRTAGGGQPIEIQAGGCS